MDGKGKLFETRSGGWTWRFKDEAAWRELGPSPQERGPSDEVVKSNAIRLVFRRKGFFVKVERPEASFGLAFLKALLAPKAKAEFEAAEELALAGVPAVEALGYGSCGAAQALVTKAFEGAQDAASLFNLKFVEEGGNPAEYLKGWAAFARKVLASGFYHPDFHNGNILYQSETGEFRLVDVFGVKRKASLTEPQRESMSRIVFELRRPLSWQALAKLAENCGAAEANAEEFLEKGLRGEAAKLAASWGKRKAQLLAAYWKYSKKSPDGKTLILLDKARRPLAEPAKLAEGAYPQTQGLQALLEAFYLELAELPHRRAVAYAPETQTVYLQQAGEPAQASSKELRAFARLAEPFGARCENSLFSRDALGRLQLEKAELDLGGPL
jgi:hypothetical protein